MSVALKKCPFCGQMPKKLGREVYYLERNKATVENTVIHPDTEDYCPLRRLVFPIVAWNRRVG